MAGYRSPTKRPLLTSSLLQRTLEGDPSPLLIILVAALVLVSLCFYFTSSSVSTSSTLSTPSVMSVMSGSSSSLLAINVCLLPPPSHAIYQRAHRLQAVMQSVYPSEYAFSSTRYAHVTLVQSYIERTSLPQLLAALRAELSGVESSQSPLALSMKPELVPGPVQEGMLVPSIAITPSPALQRLHSRLLAAMQPFRVPSSSLAMASVEERKAAFYREAGEVEIGQSIVDYVGQFEERSANARYYPHVSLGVVGEAAWTAVVRAEAETGGQWPADNSDPWTVDRVSVFQLGDWGTVRKQLEELPIGG